MIICVLYLHCLSPHPFGSPIYCIRTHILLYAQGVADMQGEWVFAYQTAQVTVGLKADTWALASIAWDCFAFSGEPLWPTNILDNIETGTCPKRTVLHLQRILQDRLSPTVLDRNRSVSDIIKACITTEVDRADLSLISLMCQRWTLAGQLGFQCHQTAWYPSTSSQTGWIWWSIPLHVRKESASNGAIF